MNFSSAVLFFLTRLRSSIFFSGKFISSPLWAPFLLIRRSPLSRRLWVSPLSFFLPPVLLLLLPFFLVYFCPFSNPKFIRSSSFFLVVSFLYLHRCAFLFSSPRIFLFLLNCSFFLTSNFSWSLWRPPIFHLLPSLPSFCRTWIQLIQPPLCSAISRR